jgi:hypothetical protein
MKEEDWRDAYSLGLLDAVTTAPVKRYKLSEILEVTDTYRASPGGSLGVGQFVFAMACCGGGCIMCGVCVGCCYPGCNLIPWGLCCIFNGQNSACTCDCFVACGFTMGTSATTYVALGSINGCGGTLFRRIS